MTTKELKEFHFYVRGFGVQVDCAPVTAKDEERAVKEALKQCKRFELPGWVLVSRESGDSYPVAKFTAVEDGRKKECRL